MEEYEASWPEGFHQPLKKRVHTMKEYKKKTRADTAEQFDSGLIFARALGVMNSRDIKALGVMNSRDIKALGVMNSRDIKALGVMNSRDIKALGLMNSRDIKALGVMNSRDIKALGVMNSRDIKVGQSLSYELASVPTSMFEEKTRDLHIAKSKSILKNKLQVEQSARATGQPDAIVIDGCAILWVVHWPSK